MAESADLPHNHTGAQTDGQTTAETIESTLSAATLPAKIGMFCGSMLIAAGLVPINPVVGGGVGVSLCLIANRGVDNFVARRSEALAALVMRRSSGQQG